MILVEDRVNELHAHKTEVYIYVRREERGEKVSRAMSIRSLPEKLYIKWRKNVPK